MSKIVIKAHNKSVDHGPNLPATQIVGPFPGSTTPSRTGIFKRDSVKRAGKKVWSYWNGNYWGMSGTNFRRAIERKNKRSAAQSQQWYGIVTK